VTEKEIYDGHLYVAKEKQTLVGREYSVKNIFSFFVVELG
jgi:hypothetical protein